MLGPGSNITREHRDRVRGGEVVIRHGLSQNMSSVSAVFLPSTWILAARVAPQYTAAGSPPRAARSTSCPDTRPRTPHWSPSHWHGCGEVRCGVREQGQKTS